MPKAALNARDAAWLADTFARNNTLYAGFRMEADPEDGGDDGKKEQTFTQAEVDKIIGRTRTEERRKVSEKYADYDDLKVKADGAKTLEDRVAELQKSVENSAARALRAEIANAHGISAEDRDLFLTGSDEESLTTQAKRLADRDKGAKKQGNHVPREGETNKPPNDEMREFTRNLFSQAAND